MQVFIATVNCSVGRLSCLLQNVAGSCKTAGVERDGHPQGGGGVGGAGHVHPVYISGSSGFPCPARAATTCRLMKANFDCANVGVTGYGVESGVDELVLLLWRASQPRPGSGLAGVRSGCLWSFRLYPLLFTPLALSHCSYHKAMATELPLWRRL